jgi:hypothetical protein
MARESISNVNWKGGRNGQRKIGKKISQMVTIEKLKTIPIRTNKRGNRRRFQIWRNASASK